MSIGRNINALIGSVELTQFENKAIARFDLTDRGFWQSFSAVLVFVPLLILATYLANTYSIAHNVAARQYSATILVQLLDWTIFTLLMLPICAFLDVSARYKNCITVYNWCRPLAACFLIPVYAAAAAGLVDGMVLGLMYYLAITLRSIYLGYVLKLTLDITIGPILAIILLDFVLGFLILEVLANTLFQTAA